jgi:hypothetical protein
VAVGAVDRAQDGPDPVLVGLLDDLVGRRPPEPIIVRDGQLERQLALVGAAAGIHLLDRELAALVHLLAQDLLVALASRGSRDGRIMGTEEADLTDFRPVGSGSDRPGPVYSSCVRKWVLNGST